MNFVFFYLSDENYCGDNFFYFFKKNEIVFIFFGMIFY